MRTILITCSFIMLNGCSILFPPQYPPLETVPSVDVNRYTGTWYEIASLPFSRQEGCSCTKAEYELMENGDLKVTNSCMQEGELSVANGKAFVVEGTGNAKLKVQFFWPFKGDYWIIDLAPDYSYAVVGVPSRKYCWILSRTKTMDDQLYAEILGRIKEKGFDISRFNKTVQECQ